jgi:hypothetical protein
VFATYCAALSHMVLYPNRATAETDCGHVGVQSKRELVHPNMGFLSQLRQYERTLDGDAHRAGTAVAVGGGST